MRVVDAGVVVGVLAGDLDPDRLGDEQLLAPHLIDSEVLHALRRLVLCGALDDEQGHRAVEGFVRLELARFSAHWLRGTIWSHRHNLTAYDATYVALAELTGATSLLTTDERLAKAPHLRCPVELL